MKTYTWKKGNGAVKISVSPCGGESGRTVASLNL